MKPEEQEKIRELLQAWSKLEPERCIDYGDMQTVILGGTPRCAKDWGKLGDLIIQAAIREACEAKGLTLETISWLAGDWYYHNVWIVVGNKDIGFEGHNLTLAMLECWIEVLRVTKEAEKDEA